MQNELLRQSNERWKKKLRIFFFVYERIIESILKNAVSILIRKQTTKEWLILPIRGAPKCVSCIKCEMGPVQNDTRNENRWGWSIVTRAHKSNIYIYVYRYVCSMVILYTVMPYLIQYIKIWQFKALKQMKIRHLKTKRKDKRRKSCWIYKSRLHAFTFLRRSSKYGVL